MTGTQNGGKESISDYGLLRDMEEVHQLPSSLRNFVLYDATDKYDVHSLIVYHNGDVLHEGVPWHEIERIVKKASRQQHIEDYRWAGTPPSSKGATTNAIQQLSELRAAPNIDRQPRKAAVQMRSPAGRKKRRRASLARTIPLNDGDYFEW